MTVQLERAWEVAEAIRGTDPCGAQLIRNLIYLVDRQKCANCKNAYGRGYTAGYKAGVNEWLPRVRQEGTEP